MNALILTGRVLPDMEEQQVWAKVAALVKLAPEAFKSRVLVRCPVTIRETADSAEAQRIMAAVAKCGAHVEITESIGGKWIMQQLGRISGPTPLSFLKAEHQAGRLAGDVKVKRTTDTEWVALANTIGEPTVAFNNSSKAEHDLSDELPPPLPPRKSVANTHAPLPPTLPPISSPGNQKLRPFDSPDNWWMHWCPLSIVLLLTIIIGTVLTKSTMWGYSVAAACATWVYYDASKQGIGKIPKPIGKCYSAGLWAVLVLFLWIVAFPSYIAKRRELIAVAQNHFINPAYRGLKLIASTFGVFLFLTYVFFGQQASASLNRSSANSPPSDTDSSEWNGYFIHGAIPDACVGKSFPSNSIIAEWANSYNAKWGSPRSAVESELIRAGNFSFSGLSENGYGSCTVYVTVRGTYEGSSFASKIPVEM